MSKRSFTSPMRTAWSLVAAGALVTSCAGPLPQVPGSLMPAMGIEALADAESEALVQGLAEKESGNWQDAMLNLPTLERRQAVYKTQAAAISATWTASLGALCSSSPAFRRASLRAVGPNPATTDYVFVATQATSNQLKKLSAVTGAVLNTWDALSGLASPGVIQNSALILSADNRRLYMVTTGGYFIIMNAGTGARIFAQKISTAGFNKSAPFVDYATSSFTGTLENVYCLSNDGSMFKIQVKNGVAQPVVAWVSQNGVDKSLASWAASPKIAYAAGQGTNGSVTCFPVVWKNTAFFGSTGGKYYRVDLSSAAAAPLTVYNTDYYTSAGSKAITAPAAFDFNSSLAITQVFAPVGDRLMWLDPTSSSVLAATRPLLVDKITPLSGTLSTYSYTASATTYTATASDCVSAATNVGGAHGPSRWGLSTTTHHLTHSGVTSPFAAGVNPNQVAIDASGNVVVSLYGAGSIQKLTPFGAVFNANFPKGGGNKPVGVGVDAAGNIYECDQGNKRVTRITADGSVNRNSGNLSNNLEGLAMDSVGAIWTVDIAADVSYKQTFDVVANAFTTVLSVPHTAGTNPIRVAVDGSNNPWMTLNATGKVERRNGTTGAVLSTYTVGTNPYGIAIDASGNAWVANEGSDTVSKITTATGVVTNISVAAYGSKPRGVGVDPRDGGIYVDLFNSATTIKIDPATNAIVRSYPTGTNPFGVKVDASGNIWTANYGSANVSKIWSGGSQADLLGADGYVGTADGNTSYGYMQFKVPNGSYGGALPVSTTVDMSSALASIGNEEIRVYDTTPTVSGAFWTGYVTTTTPSVDYNARPTVSTLMGTRTASAVTASSTVTGAPRYSTSFTNSLTLPWDLPNQSALDATAGRYAYAIKSTGSGGSARKLSDVAHFYTSAAANTAAVKPTLTVTLSKSKTPSTNGIMCQPAIDSVQKKLWVQASNALWEISYASTAAFGGSSTRFNLTAAGRGDFGSMGPARLTSPYNFILAGGNVLNTGTRLVVADYDPASNRFFLNGFKQPLSTYSTDALNMVHDAGANSGQVTTQMLWDYAGGSVYAPTQNNTLVRAKVLN